MKRILSSIAFGILFCAAMVSLYRAASKTEAAEPLVASTHCDLEIATPAGRMCFDHSDGHGQRIEFTQAQSNATYGVFVAACHLPEKETEPEAAKR